MRGPQPPRDGYKVEGTRQSQDWKGLVAILRAFRTFCGPENMSTWSARQDASIEPFRAQFGIVLTKVSAITPHLSSLQARHLTLERYDLFAEDRQSHRPSCLKVLLSGLALDKVEWRCILGEFGRSFPSPLTVPLSHGNRLETDAPVLFHSFPGDNNS